MSIRSILTVAVAATVTASAAAVAAAPASAGRWDGHGSGPICAPTLVHTIDPSTHGNPEGVAWHEPSNSFFVGATGDGTIYRGKLRERYVRPFITVDPAARRSAVGMKAVHGKLYVAGGSTGKLFVYRIRTGKLIGTFRTGSGGFLNDLVVSPRGHVTITDSSRPYLWRVTRAQVKAGTGKPKRYSLNPEMTYIGAFNANGIEIADERTFLVMQSSTGLLYRIILDKNAPFGRTVRQLAAPPVVGGDGITWDRGRLMVVDGDLARLVFLALKADLTEGVITKETTDPALKEPSTVARAWNRYLVVNADFATDTTPFSVVSLKAPRSHPASEIPADGDEWLAGALKMRH